MKGKRADNTLQTTALVHEVYLRLVDVTEVEWRQRAQFFAIAAKMMRRILVDAGRARRSHKRGGGAVRLNFDETATVSPQPDRSVLALNDVLAAFSEVPPRQAKVPERRNRGGSPDFAPARCGATGILRAWLARELS
jgi:RNA polymerase sigma factor (TIGR02999 family)